MDATTPATGALRWERRGRSWGRPGRRGYGRHDLRRDLTAGVVLSGLLVPAGMGYASASGPPVETGLYATIAALVAYALVGPSRVLVLGPDSSLAPHIAAAVVPTSAVALTEDRIVARAGVLALLVGLVLVVGGLLRLGAVMGMLSKPIRIGYLNGLAVVVIAGQAPTLLGSRPTATASSTAPWSPTASPAPARRGRTGPTSGTPHGPQADRRPGPAGPRPGWDLGPEPVGHPALPATRSPVRR